MTEKELKTILFEIDTNENGLINYHEFIAATFPVDQYATPERMQSLFQKFDTNGDKKITKSSLRDAFTKLGHHMTTVEIDEVMQEHKVDGEQIIHYDDFKNLILDHMWCATL